MKRFTFLLIILFLLTFYPLPLILLNESVTSHFKTFVSISFIFGAGVLIYLYFNYKDFNSNKATQFNSPFLGKMCFLFWHVLLCDSTGIRTKLDEMLLHYDYRKYKKMGEDVIELMDILDEKYTGPKGTEGLCPPLNFIFMLLHNTLKKYKIKMEITSSDMGVDSLEENIDLICYVIFEVIMGMIFSIRKHKIIRGGFKGYLLKLNINQSDNNFFFDIDFNDIYFGTIDPEVVDVIHKSGGEILIERTWKPIKSSSIKINITIPIKKEEDLSESVEFNRLNTMLHLLKLNAYHPTSSPFLVGLLGRYEHLKMKLGINE